MTSDKTHYRKAFNSPYLSSADIVGPTDLTIESVKLEKDRTHKTKDSFNTAYFAQKEIRPGEKLKPMILNVHNSTVLKDITGSPFIDDWLNVPVTVYVDDKVKFGRETVEGLRIQLPTGATEETLIALSDYASSNEQREAWLTGQLERGLTEVQAQQILKQWKTHDEGQK